MVFGIKRLLRKIGLFTYEINQQKNWKKTRPFRIKNGKIYWRGTPIDDDDFQMCPYAVEEYRAFMKRYGKRILRRLNRYRKRKIIYRKRRKIFRR